MLSGKLEVVVGFLRAAHKAYVDGKDEDELLANINQASCVLGELLNDSKVQDSRHLRRYVDIVNRGLVKAIETGVSDYFQADEIVKLIEGLNCVINNLVDDISDASYNHSCEYLFEALPDIMDEIVEEENDPLQMLDYRLNFPLEKGVEASIIFHNLEDVVVSFQHEVRRTSSDDEGRIVLLNESRLSVNYRKGIAADEIVLTMHIIFPKLLGTEYLYGLDVSPGAKHFIEFNYRKERIGDINYYRLHHVILGVAKRLDFDEIKEGLMKPMNFPFPLLDCIKDEGYGFSVPFLDDNGDEGFFTFQNDIRKTAKAFALRQEFEKASQSR